MTRKIVLDTETTGISHKAGHRIIEVGCIEVQGRKASGKNFHEYINPQRAVDAGAFAVHGLSNEFLDDKPKFSEIAYDLWLFLQGSELIIHNASFDVGFLNAEFAKLKMPGGASYPKLDQVCDITDTLQMARKMHPGQANSLDALCKRYSVDASGRDLHGALLDSELLLQVYLAITGGQISLLTASEQDASTEQASGWARSAEAQELPVLRASSEEIAAHDLFREKLLTDN